MVGALSAQIFGLAPPAQIRWMVRLVTGGFMIALGLYLAGWLRDFVRHPRVRQAAGLGVLLFGLYTVFAPGAHTAHRVDAAGHASAAEHAGRR